MSQLNSAAPRKPVPLKARSWQLLINENLLAALLSIANCQPHHDVNKFLGGAD